MAESGTDGRSRRWRDIARLTLLGTAAAIAVSLLVSYLLLFSETMTPLGRSVALAIALPVLVAAPLLAFIGLKLQELRGYRQRLNRLATYDQTTGLMNGAALASVVDRRVRAYEVEDPGRGGFLVVRLDNLSGINMRHGFEAGDEALRLVASAVRASIRESDTVGRLGASEFGVFLPGATEANARDVGERIRAGVERTAFAPGGIATGLEVSTGGVLFEDEFGFGDMFRGAEQQLASGQSRGGMALARIAGPHAETRPTH